MSFAKLRAACTITNIQTRHHERISDWVAKRDALVVLMHDLPTLAALHKNRPRVPISPDSEITTADPVPPIRLQSACEAATNTLYGMSEIAANFGNKTSKGKLPSSFNELRKKAQDGKLGSELLAALGDLQWYEKVRELRTEWAHYSTVFIGIHTDGEPLLVVRAYRRESDRKQFKDRLQCTIPEIIDWTGKAIATIDGFASYLLTTYVLPGFDMDAPITCPIRDEHGYPLIRNARFAGTETITVREHLQRMCVMPRPDTAPERPADSEAH